MWTNLAAKISSEGCFLLSGVISTNALSGNTSAVGKVFMTGKFIVSIVSDLW